ncbi:hypothetical protein BDZ45DRAFT_746642 [Acephala macrosclerotiorum]|nr:hypothetical protein BDZ45DRAFT_746642 [Acephala macrosclerotiorum]
MTRLDLKKLLLALPPLEIPHPIPTTFYPFRRLPNELKNRIWTYVVSEPRYVRVYDFTGGSHFLRQNPRVDDQHPIPPILHVNHQAREEGLRYYSRCMEKGLCRWKWESYYNEPRPNRRIVFINFSIDRLLYEMPQPNIQGSFHGAQHIRIDRFNFDVETMKKCQHLAVFHTGPYPLNRFDSILRVEELLAVDKAIDVTIVAQISPIRAMPESVAGDLFRKRMQSYFEKVLPQVGVVGREINIAWKELEEVQLPPWSGNIEKYRSFDKALPRWESWLA